MPEKVSTRLPPHSLLTNIPFLFYCDSHRFVMNSWKEGGVSNLPWMHPSVIPIVKHAIELRYRLLPYLWSLFEAATALNEPIIRPLWYDFPEDPLCFEDSDDFMVGGNLLFAPVVTQGQTERLVYFPLCTYATSSHATDSSSGSSREPRVWVDFHTNARFEGGRTYSFPVTLATVLLFAREGARIPV